MAQAGSLSDEWELLPANHDILSCSDTETSDGGEIDSQEASAIIEAIGEAPSAGLQVRDLCLISAVASFCWP
jgi:hypothetical protein